MVRFVVGMVLTVLLVLVIGTVVLEEFPQVQPLFDELKHHVVTLYDMSIVKYGSVATVLIIVGIFILVGNSRGF